MAKWDKELADEVAAEFKADLEEHFSTAPQEEVAFFLWLQAEWEGAYRTCGHKRLGRVIVRVKLD